MSKFHYILLWTTLFAKFVQVRQEVINTKIFFQNVCRKIHCRTLVHWSLVVTYRQNRLCGWFYIYILPN
ncbi:unnamed protein product [Nezara viridula]|uniref:Neuropeptide n=1 Tax=Nezara viridula TaxID=85310 RepID=A0A9P0HDJ4_NEZVI|nr:unnamed protein product [Nezara viridula]